MTDVHRKNGLGAAMAIAIVTLLALAAVAVMAVSPGRSGLIAAIVLLSIAFLLLVAFITAPYRARRNRRRVLFGEDKGR